MPALVAQEVQTAPACMGPKTFSLLLYSSLLAIPMDRQQPQPSPSTVPPARPQGQQNQQNQHNNDASGGDGSDAREPSAVPRSDADAGEGERRPIVVVDGGTSDRPVVLPSDGGVLRDSGLGNAVDLRADFVAAADATPPLNQTPPMQVPPVTEWPLCAGPGAPQLADGLLLYLRLDESGLDPVLSDSSSNKLSTTVSGLDSGGASWVGNGRRVGGLALAGGANGGWVSIGGTNTLNDAASGFAFSAWVRFPPGRPNNGVIAARRAEGPFGYLYRISVADGRLRAQLHTSNGFNADQIGNQLLPTDGRWMHVTVSYEINGVLGLFVNGTPYGAMRFGLQLGPENTPLIIGGAENVTRPAPGGLTTGLPIVDRMAGALDEVAFYKRPLTSIEVMALACGASPVP